MTPSAAAGQRHGRAAGTGPTMAATCTPGALHGRLVALHPCVVHGVSEFVQQFPTVRSRGSRRLAHTQKQCALGVCPCFWRVSTETRPDSFGSARLLGQQEGVTFGQRGATAILDLEKERNTLHTVQSVPIAMSALAVVI